MYDKTKLKNLRELTRFVRGRNCGVCGKQVWYDSDKKLIGCGCGVFKCNFINTQEFIPVKKKKRNKPKQGVHSQLPPEAAGSGFR
jgi:hypothetical protein